MRLTLVEVSTGTSEEKNCKIDCDVKETWLLLPPLKINRLPGL